VRILSDRYPKNAKVVNKINYMYVYFYVPFYEYAFNFYFHGFVLLRIRK